jgi:oxygen-dependent protoporphyrinogen oxidase
MEPTSAAAAPENRSGARPHVVVVGGGIAGLAAAHTLLTTRGDVDVTLLEAAPMVGGKLRLGDVAGQQVDLGAEAILNRRPEAVGLARAVGLADDVVHPLTTSAGIWTRGGVRSLPRTVMGVPADMDALRASGIVSRRAVARARLERGLRRLDVSDDIAVGRLVAHRIGSELRDRLVEPLLGGVYAGRADELSLHATVPQLVPAIAEHGGLLAAAAAVAPARPSERAAETEPAAETDSPTERRPAADTEPVPVFAGITGGVGRLASATAAAVRTAGGSVRCLVTVREITRSDDGFRLVTGPTVAPEVIRADAVILATPAAPTARLLRELAPAAAVDLDRLDYASMAVVTLALEPPPAAVPLVGSGFLVPPVDGHDIKAATFSSRKWGWHAPDMLLVRCSIGRYGEERQLQHDDTDLVARALLDLRNAVGVPGRLLDAVVTRWGGALPQYPVGHLDAVRRIRAAVAAVPGLGVCGAAYDGVGLPACVASATRAATQVLEALRPEKQ